jgi:hypothetical protein
VSANARFWRAFILKEGTDLSIHRIGATPDRDVTW